jgi:GTPase KRas
VVWCNESYLNDTFSKWRGVVQVWSSLSVLIPFRTIQTVSMNKNVYKIVVLGEGGVGKTALVLRMCFNRFDVQYDPTIEDSYQKYTQIEGESCIIDVTDTGGQEKYASLRDQWLKEGDGFMLVYSIASMSSFRSIEKYYQAILRAQESLRSTTTDRTSGKSDDWRLPNVILVGNKSDLEDNFREVTMEEGLGLAQDLQMDFMETSAKESTNVEQAFIDLVRKIKTNKMNSTKSSKGRKSNRKNEFCTLS